MSLKNDCMMQDATANRIAAAGLGRNPTFYWKSKLYINVNLEYFAFAVNKASDTNVNTAGTNDEELQVSAMCSLVVAVNRKRRRKRYKDCLGYIDQ